MLLAAEAESCGEFVHGRVGFVVVDEVLHLSLVQVACPARGRTLS